MLWSSNVTRGFAGYLSPHRVRQIYDLILAI